MKKTIIFMVVIVMIFASCSCEMYDEYTHIGEKANLLDDYIVQVNSIVEKNSVCVLKNANDLEMTDLFSKKTHFLEISVTIKKTASSKTDIYSFDNNDFKIKDHPGTALGETPVSELDAINDYTWVNTTIASGEEKTVVLFFEVDKNITVENDLFLEFDFSNAIGNGVDVYLKKR